MRSLIDRKPNRERIETSLSTSESPAVSLARLDERLLHLGIVHLLLHGP